MNEATNQNRNRLVIIGIAALFFVPLLAAIIMQSDWVGYEPSTTTNRGDLVNPPVPLKLHALQWHGEKPAAGGQWVMLQVIEPGCGQECIDDVTTLRQVHKASGRHQDDVAVVILPTGTLKAASVDALMDIYDRFYLATGQNTLALEAVEEALVNAGNQEGGPAGAAFMLDPSGNIMLSYAAGYPPGDINGDLKKLLKWSSGN